MQAYPSPDAGGLAPSALDAASASGKPGLPKPGLGPVRGAALDSSLSERLTAALATRLLVLLMAAHDELDLARTELIQADWNGDARKRLSNASLGLRVVEDGLAALAGVTK